MKNELPKQWLNNLKILDIAFQPILNIHTGEIFAVESLLRNFQEIGFKSIFALFDKVYEEGLLYSFDIALREKALIKFSTISNYENIKLFYNLDNRLLEMTNFTHGSTNKILKNLGIKKENICFEISERHEISGEGNLENILNHYQNENFCIAIDDFGVGYSGYKLLYDSTPNIIKIDRFFLQDIESNLKKKLLVTSITHLAIQLGVKVIAEGVETKEELLTCKEIGCHMVQGYLVQKPTKNSDEILQKYAHIEVMVNSDKRNKKKSSKLENYLDKPGPLHIDTKMQLVIEYFKKNSTSDVIPVVNSFNEPMGILQEKQIKEFLYSPYGMSLLLNDGPNKSKLKNLIKYCGFADISSSISTLVELFSNNADSIGIIITKNSKYYGFMSARAIISIMNEENLIVARDQNPLTKLPGNRIIEHYLSKIPTDAHDYALCYFDLDNFKAFNDVYGFRNGDRVIQLFADMLRKELSSDFFIAHIGGDDFFCAIDVESETSIHEIFSLVQKFTNNVKEFYSQEDKKNGYIISTGRESTKKKFPLLTVSASIVILNQHTKNRNIDNINKILSLQKKVAKEEVNHISMSSVL